MVCKYDTHAIYYTYNHPLTSSSMRFTLNTSAVAIIYKSISILFLVLAVLSLFSALILLANGFLGNALFLLGYTALNSLFAHGLWKQKHWMLLLSTLNAIGLVVVKVYGLLNGSVTWLNVFACVVVSSGLALFIYSTRASLVGKRSLHGAIFSAYIIILIPILLRSVGLF